MTTVVAIMDRAGWSERTDNIVVVDPARRRLLWVPRDLWCTTIGDRINEAFARGGHRQLTAALAEHGIDVQDSICVRREVTERAFEELVVTVPVLQPLEFWYPLSPQLPIEDGRKLISFLPPSETLSGERIHQWIGARTEIGCTAAPDFRRIARQQEFVRCVLRQGIGFWALLDDPDLVRVSSPNAIGDVSRVQPNWKFELFRDVVGAWIDGKQVLVPRSASQLPIRALRRLRAWTRR